MRRPFGTYFARPSGHESFSIEAGLMNVPLYLNGIVADSICCQTLCLNSLASVDDAVNTIFGEPTSFLRLRYQYRRNRADSAHRPLVAAGYHALRTPGAVRRTSGLRYRNRRRTDNGFFEA